MINQARLFGMSEAKALLPAVSTRDNKTTRGRSLIIAGSAEYPGAGVLSARAALRAGSGYVILAQDHPPFQSLDNPDFLVLDLARHEIQKQHFVAAAIGPGCGVNESTEHRIEALAGMALDRVVVDADALTVLAQKPNLPHRPSWIFTPHEGELSRLMNVSSEVIREDRQRWARNAQKQWNCVLLLKGSGTLVCSGDDLVEIRAGNPALAKSGTGDVLTGIITAFLAQGLSSKDAACLGAFVHGYTADQWVQGGRDPLSMLASDLIEHLPQALHSIRNG